MHLIAYGSWNSLEFLWNDIPIAMTRIYFPLLHYTALSVRDWFSKSFYFSDVIRFHTLGLKKATSNYFLFFLVGLLVQKLKGSKLGCQMFNCMTSQQHQWHVVQSKKGSSPLLCSYSLGWTNMPKIVEFHRGCKLYPKYSGNQSHDHLVSFHLSSTLVQTES